MKSKLSTRQIEVLEVVLKNMSDKRIELDEVMRHVADRTPFITRRLDNNNGGNYRDQRRNGVVQALRMMGYKLNLRGARFVRFSPLGRGNRAVYGFKDMASVHIARRVLKEDRP